MKKNKQLRCYGCGAIIQSFNPCQNGYVPSEAIRDENHILCQRCFRIQHYRQEENIFPVTSDYLKILEKAGREEALIVYVIDFFTFDFSFVEQINQYLSRLNIIVVVNKRDVLPKSFNDKFLLRHVRDVASLKGLKVVDIILTSAENCYHIDELLEKINKYRQGHSVYMVGSVSSGKSSLINVLLKNYINETKHLITTSPFPGTTLDSIEVPLDNKTYIYDTPGFPIKGSMLDIVKRSLINQIMPQKEMKARIYQLLCKQSLVIGGLCHFDFIDGPKTNFVVYASPGIIIERCKLEKVYKTFFSLMKNRQVKPIDNRYNSEEHFETHEFILEKGKYEICLVGYCWIIVDVEIIKINITLVKDAQVSVRRVDKKVEELC